MYKNILSVYEKSEITTSGIFIQWNTEKQLKMMMKSSYRNYIRHITK